MPVYEYRCPDCAQVFEKLVSLADARSEAPCPTCGAPAGKLLSTFAPIGAAGGAASELPMAPARGGGGCCGGGCCGG